MSPSIPPDDDAQPPHEPRLAPGTELLGLIRVGARVRVSPRLELYEGEHLILGRDVHVWLRTDLERPEDPRRARFVQRMAQLARARRRELLDLYQPFEHEAAIGAVSEVVTRPTLADELAQRPGVAWSPSAVVKWIAPMLHALQTLHALGIVHGRLSPGSVVRPRSEARLVDLVDLRLAPPSLDSLDLDAHLDLNDARTLAPEWLAAPDEVGPGADLYAVGCILFRLLTGRDPFCYDEPRMLLAAHLAERPPEPTALVPGLDEGMARIVLRALSKHTGFRFESAAEMAAALEQHASYLRPVPIGSPPWSSHIESLLVTLAPPTDTEIDDGIALDDDETWPGPPPDDPLATMPGRFIRLPEPPAPEARASEPAAPAPSPPSEAPRPAPSPAPLEPRGAPSGQDEARPGRGGRAWLVMLGLALAGGVAALGWWAQATPDGEVEVVVEPRPGHVSELLGGELAAGEDMVVVPGGVGLLGSGGGDGVHETLDARAVWLSPFAIDRREVSAGEYAVCVQAGLCEPRQGPQPAHDGAAGDDAHLPATHVTWTGADEFCRVRGKRLPTEAEWEKAARGSEGRTWPWGEALGCRRAHVGGECASAATGPEPVGTRPSGASPYGVENLADNVWEWTADWYAGADWHLQRGAARDPAGPPSGPGRVIKGGDFAAAPRPSAARAWNMIDASSERGGFRCALSLPGAPRSGLEAIFGAAPRLGGDRLARYLLGAAGDAGPVLSRPRSPR